MVKDAFTAILSISIVLSNAKQSKICVRNHIAVVPLNTHVLFALSFEVIIKNISPKMLPIRIHTVLIKLVYVMRTSQIDCRVHWSFGPTHYLIPFSWTHGFT